MYNSEIKRSITPVLFCLEPPDWARRRRQNTYRSCSVKAVRESSKNPANVRDFEKEVLRSD